MKLLNKLALVVVGFGSLIVMSACGNSNTNAAAATSCGSGYTYSAQYGCQYTGVNGVNTGSNSGQTCSQGYAWSTTYTQCLPQTNTCVGAYGIYNNSCVPLGTATTNTGGHTPYQGSCTSGLVQTSMGCIQQGVCQTGYGFGYWGGQAYCFPATASY
jgi:hypothetical protein